MKLLITTQAVDLDDPVLSFMHSWIAEFSKHFESIEIICLREGRHSLPHNVRVHSLGKEGGASRLKYLVRFYGYAWMLRQEYDAVFVHMNQEYVLLGALFWKLFGKRVYMWRNHYVGSALTALAARLCTKIFYTSKYSYTNKYRNAVQMPVGVDTEKFHSVLANRVQDSILFLGRMSPSKRPDIFIKALGILKERSVMFSGDIYGDALPADRSYLEQLRNEVRTLGLEKTVHFHGGIPNQQTPEIYSAHGIFVNASKSGMYDKTIFEALACGCLSIASSADYSEIGDQRLTFDGSAEDLAKKLESLLRLPVDEIGELRVTAKKIAETQSLQILATKLAEEMGQ